jgi:hypothetical protein
MSLGVSAIRALGDMFPEPQSYKPDLAKDQDKMNPDDTARNIGALLWFSVCPKRN